MAFGTLYLIATPIGNLSDLSPRAIETLETVDFIAAEDTRVTGGLLNHFGIKKPMVSYYQHNMRERSEQLIARIAAGESCGLVSDAGMPCISDPGEVLVRLAAEAGIPVSVIPGACAAVSALAVSGLPTGRFSFEGFLSVNKNSRREQLSRAAGYTGTLIFYEAPHKLKNTLNDLYSALGDRPITLVRELTKLHEEIIRTTLSAAQGLYEEKEPRGEYVLIVGGAKEEAPSLLSPEDALSYARQLIAQGTPPSAAAKEAAKKSELSKPELYRMLMEE